MNIGEYFENGSIVFASGLVNAKDIGYTPHPKFEGVYLKHLVTGKNTDNQLSCHLVKVDPFCILDTHIHENSAEIHEVIYGSGIAEIGGHKAHYNKGTLGLIPKCMKHRVEAGENGLYILAKFTPALL